MFIPLSFIRRYLDINDKDLIVDGFQRLGIEVENVYKVGFDFNNVKIGKIVEKVDHPNADRVVICKVDFGGDILQILTADKTVEVGDIVLVALSGSTLPNGLKIEKRNIRGIESFGMMLSLSELGWEGIKAYGEGVSKFNFDNFICSNLGKELGEVITTSDWVIEIKPLANKVETLGVFHLAKELSFLLKLPIKENIFANFENFGIYGDDSEKKLDVVLLTNGCKYYKALFLDDVKINYSPVQFQLMLNWMGSKPINNVVDLTNFLMYEFSNPLHAFDGDDVKEALIVRQGKKGEIIQALDGKDYEIDENDIVISDKEDKVLALGGVIGSRLFSIKESTRNVIFEIANFVPSFIRRTSKRLALYTNSSKRFDKGIPSIYVDYAHIRLLNLLKDFGIYKGISGFSVAGKVESHKTVKVDIKKLESFIGIDFGKDEIENIVKVFSFDLVWKNENEFELKTYRNDINEWWDVAEELCRFIGFNSIVEQALNNQNHEKIYSFQNTFFFKDSSIHKISKIRESFVDNGYYEVIGYNLLNPNYLKLFGNDFLTIVNYMSFEHSAYRNSVLPSVLLIASNNYKAGYKHFKIFEIGRVFRKNKEFYELGFVVLNESKSYIFDNEKYILNEIQKLKSIFGDIDLEVTDMYDFLSPGYKVLVKGNDVGFVGILNHKLLDHLYYPPLTLIGQVGIDEVEFGYKTDKSFSDFSEFPLLYKDISFFVDGKLDFSKLKRIFNNSFENILILKDFYLIDIYEIEQRKSYTFRLELKPLKEVTNEEINGIIEKVFEELKEMGIKRRGS